MPPSLPLNWTLPCSVSPPSTGSRGQERDVILFSPVIGAASRMTAMTFLQKDHRRLNVAVSRARSVAHVFGDLDFGP